MGLFCRNKGGIDQAIDGAVALAAERWLSFAAQSGLAGNINLRDRVAFFWSGFREALERRYPALRGPADALLLLIIAQGIEASGLESRRMIELQLGIILPPR